VVLALYLRPVAARPGVSRSAPADEGTAPGGGSRETGTVAVPGGLGPGTLP
jgi:hypothetical protein